MREAMISKGDTPLSCGGGGGGGIELRFVAAWVSDFARAVGFITAPFTRGVGLPITDDAFPDLGDMGGTVGILEAMGDC